MSAKIKDNDYVVLEVRIRQEDSEDNICVIDICLCQENADYLKGESLKEIQDLTKKYYKDINEVILKNIVVKNNPQ